MQPAATRGSDLAGDHRDRVVPRRDGGGHADRLTEHEEALVGPGRGDRLAVDPLGLFREPQQEVGGIAHFVAGHAQRLALLRRHQPGQVLPALQHEPVGLVQHGRPLVGGGAGPSGERGLRRHSRRARLRPFASAAWPRISPVAGLREVKVRPDLDASHFPSMNSNAVLLCADERFSRTLGSNSPAQLSCPTLLPNSPAQLSPVQPLMHDQLRPDGHGNRLQVKPIALRGSATR